MGTMSRKLLAVAVAPLLLAACSNVPSRDAPMAEAPRHHRTAWVGEKRARALAEGGAIGTASFYRAPGLTAAHRSLPFGTKVRVTNTANGRSVVVRIADRGPFIRGRSIDLSHQAAEAVGMTHAGIAQVRMEVIR
jgi:rare lipoprotein A